MDIALEKDGKTIGCEISITSTAEQEIKNIEKCLAAGFDQVVLVSTDKKFLNKAKDLVEESLSQNDLKRAIFLTPEEFLPFLEEKEAQAGSKEQTVRGYKVKVQYRPVGENEKKAKKQAIAQTIVQALKRLNKGT